MFLHQQMTKVLIVQLVLSFEVQKDCVLQWGTFHYLFRHSSRQPFSAETS